MPDYFMIGIIAGMHYLDQYSVMPGLWYRYVALGLTADAAYLRAIQYRQSVLFYNAN